MGTPETEGGKYDALGDLGGLLVPAHIRYYHKKGTILDVGAGWGKYRTLLPEFEMDACEIWKPYIDEENLEERYRKVFNIDICDIHDIFYDVIILGDVLEHIELSKARAIVQYLKHACTQLYLVVPYEYHQGEVNGNKYEIHQQDDLTDESVRSRYGVTLLAKDDIKGVYIKSPGD